MGFEPTRGDPIGLAGRRLTRSAKVSVTAQFKQYARALVKLSEHCSFHQLGECELSLIGGVAGALLGKAEDVVGEPSLVGFMGLACPLVDPATKRGLKREQDKTRASQRKASKKNKTLKK